MPRWTSFAVTAVLGLSVAACSGGGDDPVTPPPPPPPAQSIGVQLSAASGTVARGASGNTTVTLSRVGNYTGSVSITAENLPAGVTASITPTPLTGTASSATAVFTVGATAAAGSASITVRASGSGVSDATTTYALTIPAPAVALTAGSGATSIVVGGSATVPITITRSNGFAEAVTLAATGLPTGVTAAFAPATIAAGSTTSTLTLTVAGTAAAGPSTVSISASGTGVTTQSASLALTLTAATAPAISLTSTPAAVSIVAGANGTTAIGVSRTGGFAGDVTLALEGAPAGVSGAFSANPVLAAGSSSTLTISTTGAAAPGIYNLTVRGTGIGVTATTTTVAVTVTAVAGITVSAAPTAVSVAAGNATTTAVTITRAGGYAADVSLAATGLPAGVSAAFAPPTLTGGTLTSTLTLTTTTAATAGAAAVTVTASGTGVTAQTTTVNLTVTATAPTPTYTMAATSVSAQQGANGTSTVTLTRGAGFIGTVNLAVTGLPAGVTATFNPAAVTGTTSTLTLAVGGGVTAGNYTGVITGTTTGLANVTTNVALTVTAPGGGTGNVNWRFCDPTDLPLFFAFRNGTSGAWTRVTPGANNTYSFSQSGLGSVAIVRPLEGGVANVLVYNFTATEMAATALQECTSNPPNKSLNGSFANVGAGQTGSAYLGGGFGTAVAPALTFSMSFVGDGVSDLLAFRYSTTIGANFIPALTPDRVVLRRNVNYAAGSTIPVIDFTGAESFAPSTATYNVSGVGAGEISQTITSFVTSNGTSGSFLFGSLLGGTGPTTVYGVPSNRLTAGDFHLVFATASAQDGSTTRGVFQYNRELANRTIALGGQLTAPMVTSVGTAPYVRLRASGSWQAEYNDNLGVTFQQEGQATSRSWTISSSRAFQGAGSAYVEEIPDLSGVSGFNNTWGLRPGVSTTTSLSANGGIAGTIGTPGEGSTWRFAARTSTMTP